MVEKSRFPLNRKRPADTKSIEVYVYENGLSPDKHAVFNFDVPPVETMTLEKYAASLN